MDRARRAEPYSNATIWTREIARNLAGHLARISKAHSYVDTTSPKTRLLPQFQHHQQATKRCATSPSKTRSPLHPEPSRDRLKAEHDDPDEPEERGDNDTDTHDGDIDSVLHLSADPNDSSTRTLEPLRHVRTALPTKKKKSKSRHDGSKKAKLEADRLDAIAHENQRLQERLAKIATPTAKQHLQHLQQTLPPRPSSSCNSSSNSPGLHSADNAMRDAYERQQPPKPTPTQHDYNKKQEQLKIWTENQALVKRLRTAKTTLKPKEWAKDDKVHQQFLRTQEKRRIALQHELLKAQLSPQLLLVRSTPKYLRDHQHPHHVDASHIGSSSPKLQRLTRTETTSGLSDVDHSRASAANHRRIMQLRSQRSAPSSDSHGALAAQVDNQLDTDASTADRSERDADSDVDEVTTALALDAAAYFDGDADSVVAVGAFSPAVELESALEEMATLSESMEQTAAEIEATATAEVRAIEDDSTDAADGRSSLSTDSEVNAAVFDALQDTIDQIADAVVTPVVDTESGVYTDESVAPVPACDPVDTETLTDTFAAVAAYGSDTSEVQTRAVESLAGAESDALVVDSDGDEALSTVPSSPSSTDPTLIERHDDERIPSDSDALDNETETPKRTIDAAAIVCPEEDEVTDSDAIDTMDVLPSDSVPATLSVDDSSREPALCEPEYDDDGFDDTSQRSEIAVGGEPSPAPIEVQAELQQEEPDHDSDSGYGSEFDDDVEHAQLQCGVDGAASVEIEARDPEPSAGGDDEQHVDDVDALNDDDDETYDDQYDEDDDDGDGALHISHSNNAHDELDAEQRDNASSYSDDDDFGGDE